MLTLRRGPVEMFRKIIQKSTCNRFFASYIQGQEPSPKIREYFYYINHEGMLFLDDSKIMNFVTCLKDKKFLQFFFNRLKLNDTARYQDDFPYISICGRERNFVRCDDYPIVYTEILTNKETGEERLSYAHAGDLLTVPFDPIKIAMMTSGRVYYPAQERHGSVGLVRSKLAIELSRHFEFKDDFPTHFNWNGKRLELDTEWLRRLNVDK